jgi:pyruvate formate lyase activating enzyme
MQREAMFYRQEDGKVRCRLCRHECLIAPSKRGICQIRENQGGKLVTLNYRKAISVAIDPIEKKPFYHFLPGSTSLSIATVGCNFRCLHCQNYSISQAVKELGEIPGEDIPPEDVVAIAKKEGCESISYTYTEPTIFYEYAFDIARLAKKEGLANTFVTNGYIGEDALREISPYLDAANIDLKGFTEKFYREVCGAKLQPILDSIRLHHELGIWVEIATLVIPGYNDTKEDFDGISKFIASMDPEIPWHVTRFHPDFKMDSVPATPLEKLREAREIGLRNGLKYVFEGNIPGKEESDTHCPKCGALLVKRYGFSVTKNIVKNGKCPECGNKIAGRFP